MKPEIPPLPVDVPVPEPEQRVEDHVVKAIICALAAYFLFTAMQAAAKLLSGTYSVIEISFYRNLIGLIPVIIYMRMKNYPLFPKTDKPFIMGVRVAIGGIGLVVTFGAIKYLPMADATVIFFTGILMTPALAFFLLKEHIGPHRWGAITIGLCGVVLMLHPSGHGQLLGVILAFIAAFMQGAVAVVLRHLRSESPINITFYFIVGGLVITGLFMPFVAKVPQPDSWDLFLFVGISGAFGQYLITTAYRLAPASLIAPFGYSGLIWATLFDVTLWGVIPGWSVCAGGAIIILSNLYIGHRERLAEQRRKLPT